MTRCAWVVGALSLSISLLPASPVDGATWNQIPEFPNLEAQSVQLHGTMLFVTGDDRVWFGDSLGTQWSASMPVGASPIPLLAVIPAGGGLWVGSYGSGVFFSSDLGATWSARNSGFSGQGAGHITRFVVRDGTLFAATDGAGVFALDLANPVTWTTFRDGMPVSTSGGVSTIILHGTTLVAPGGGNGFVYRCLQGSTTWQESSIQPPILPGFVASDLYSHGNTVLVASGNLLYRSQDNAQTWERSDTGLANGLETRFAGTGNVVYAMISFLGNQHQLFQSVDSAASWQALDSVQSAYVLGIAVAGDRLFAARSDGLWWTPLATTPVTRTTWSDVKARFGGRK